MICMYFHKDDVAIMWKSYAIMMLRGDCLSDGCKFACLTNTLGGRP